ncbi:MAG: glycosyltransferase family 2 protein [Vicinamibacterales bacterium]
MSAPFFTIAIPTKNRPLHLRDAVQSVLAQTFRDFEVVVCDNSDAGEADETAAVAAGFEDARVRYVRTGGTLSMPDNWEHAVSAARGEFVSILTDRSVLRRDALALVHERAASTGLRLFGWFPDRFAPKRAGDPQSVFTRRLCSLQEYRFESRRVLAYYLNGQPKFGSKVLPKLMTSACHRSVIDTVRASAIGRICPPVCPDYTSGFLMLAHTDEFLLIDDGLFVSCGVGNGASFRRRGVLADRFMRDLGLSWKQLVEFMPTEACFTHALVLNDYERVARALPDRFAGLALNRAQYYVGCLGDYQRAARLGSDRWEDLDALTDGLALERDDVRVFVQSTQLYLQGISALPVSRARGELAEVEGGDSGPAREFATVFDALAWSETHPRQPSPRHTLTMPPLDALKQWDAPSRGGAVA